jgi:hypothetical protein
MLIFLAFATVTLLVIIEMENAPLYKDGKFIYKEWYTIFGIKIKRNK